MRREALDRGPASVGLRIATHGLSVGKLDAVRDNRHRSVEADGEAPGLGVCGGVQGAGLTQVAPAHQGKVKSLLEPSVIHRPRIEHAGVANDVRHARPVGLDGGAVEKMLPHAVDVNDVDARSEHIAESIACIAPNGQKLSTGPMEWTTIPASAAARRWPRCLEVRRR